MIRLGGNLENRIVSYHYAQFKSPVVLFNNKTGRGWLEKYYVQNRGPIHRRHGQLCFIDAWFTDITGAGDCWATQAPG